VVICLIPEKNDKTFSTDNFLEVPKDDLKKLWLPLKAWTLIGAMAAPKLRAQWQPDLVASAMAARLYLSAMAAQIRPLRGLYFITRS
jgi:hypothetical protein